MNRYWRLYPSQEPAEYESWDKPVKWLTCEGCGVLMRSSYCTQYQGALVTHWCPGCGPESIECSLCWRLRGGSHWTEEERRTIVKDEYCKSCEAETPHEWMPF